MAGGQWLTDSRGTRWFFDSGALCLDFGYTGDYGYGHPEWEQLHHPEDLTAWLTERFGTPSAPATVTDLAGAHQLRAGITAIARAVAGHSRPQSEDIDVINEAAAHPDLVPVLAGGAAGRPAVGVGQALSSIARDAIVLFSGELARIRHCGAEDCALIFFDSSRPNTRRWCSMQRCGNRTKVRTHRSHRSRVSPQAGGGTDISG